MILKKPSSAFAQKNGAAIPVALLIAINLSFLLDFQYKNGREALQKKWQPAFDTANPQGYYKPVIDGRHDIAGKYNIEISLSDMRGSLEIEFSDEYSWILDLFNEGRTGFYHNAVDNKKEYISKVSSQFYHERLFGPGKQPDNQWSPTLKNIKIFLACDLIGRSASVYLNNILLEKIDLQDKVTNYFVGMRVRAHPHPTPGRIFLKKLIISDNNGKTFFESNYITQISCKILSRICFYAGLIIFFVYLLSGKPTLMKLLFLLSILILTELFLRVTEAGNPVFNVHKIQVKWEFEKTTNLFGTYNNPDTIEISGPNKLPVAYNITKAENSIRIICLGSCPLVGAGLNDPANQVFPAILYKKINPQGEAGIQVINISLPQTTINSAEMNIYLRDVLFRLNPDVIVIYHSWGPLRNEMEKEVLYRNAREILEKNSGWIKNSRLLYMALEFRRPIKEIVYLYNSLCESFLFMGIENFRKNVFNRVFRPKDEAVNNKSEYSFRKTIELYKGRETKIILIPQFNFTRFGSDPKTRIEMEKISREYNNVYYLDLRNAFLANKSSFISYDIFHPSEYGHRIIADEIYNKLVNEGLITAN